MTNLHLIVIGIVILGSAAVAMSLRNLIHSALLLTVSWFGMAAFFLWAGAQFVGFAQVFIYVGAISMVVLFAVLLTRNRKQDERTISRAAFNRGAAGIVTAAIVAAVLLASIMATPFSDVPAETADVSIRQIGEQLMGPQVASLLIVGVLLTVALIGAVVIASVDKREVRK
jgi:NADH:ubiquinone oxidoreductase subunit 6 (subunit J)